MAISIPDIQSKLKIDGKTFFFFNLPKFAESFRTDLDRLPFSLRVLLEGCLRNLGQRGFKRESIEALFQWQPQNNNERHTVPFMPARILMQDFTGVPVLNDLAGLRAALSNKGKDIHCANPRIPCDLIIDHSLNVEAYGCPEARKINERAEFDKNKERYQFLKWSEQAFKHLRVLPPGLGICHQVNLEYLGQVAFTQDQNGKMLVYSDSVLGTDSHTTMINGLGILGWGVGGIEALAAMLGYASEFPIPDVIGVELTGDIKYGVTPTDLTLVFTSRMRQVGVVGKFVEVYGDGVANLPVETRAMISNMSPESGATTTYFPVDHQTLDYLRRTGRDELGVNLVEAYFRAQCMFIDDNTSIPLYSQAIKIDLAEIQPMIAGPKRPQDVIHLSKVKMAFNAMLTSPKGMHGFGKNENQLEKKYHVLINGQPVEIPQGAILIAAITSCTNTSDPSVMVAAGLLARNAAAIGLAPKPWVKTSLAPGSRAVETYLGNAGLLDTLAQMGFSIVGFGCTTCIGNSGPIDAAFLKLVREEGLVSAAVLSGNRNFEGRIHPDVLASFLASPPLVLAYALAGRIDFDFEREALGFNHQMNPVYLKDIYPSKQEIQEVISQTIQPYVYNQNYQGLYDGNPRWNRMEIPQGEVFSWSDTSTMILEPGFLYEPRIKDKQGDIENARVLVFLGDSITTDHISPAGRIAPDILAGRYLEECGIKPSNFISFGARRGNHEVMARGTFSNPRLRNRLVPEVDGGFTRYLVDGKVMTIYEAAQKYMANHIPLVILAGKAYGSGSSRDWAAKGTYLLGVRAVVAESYERIHRTNLICMGILPLQYPPGLNAGTLGLTGEEKFTIHINGKINTLKPELLVSAIQPGGSRIEFKVTALIDSPLELDYFKAGGLAHKILNDL